MAEPARWYGVSEEGWSEGPPRAEATSPGAPAPTGQDGFDAIFAAYGDSIYSYVYRLMGNAEDARDFTQDAFLRAYAALPRMPDDLNVRPWLYRIATNVCLDELRRRQRIRWIPWESLVARFWDRPSNDPGPERLLLAHEDAITVQRVLGQLPPRYRSALLLREYQDLSYEQMASALRTSVGGVKSLLYRAREAFRVAYQALGREEGWTEGPALEGTADGV
jgi:RNA polymerase sigma-70 factor (ECF subfamily)